MKCKPYNSDDFTPSNANEPAVAYAYTNHTTGIEERLLQPDDDLRRAITVEELLEGIHEDIRRKYALLRPDDDLRRAITIDEVRDNIVEYIRKKHALRYFQKKQTNLREEEEKFGGVKFFL